MTSTFLRGPGHLDARGITLVLRAAAIAIVLSCFTGAGVVPDDVGTGSPPGELRAAKVAPHRILMTQIPAGSHGDDAFPGGGAGWGRLPDGARIVVFDPAESETELTDLTPEFAAAGRPDLSFDGERLLFVARRAPDDPTGVWEMRIDGTGVREVVRPEGDCEAAIYLSTIFTLDAERPAHQVGFAMSDPADAHVSLHTCLMDGSKIRRITFTPYGVSDPLLLGDGRLLFAMTSGGADARMPSSTLFTINTDGTDVFPFAGQHEPPARRCGPCETDGGDVVYVESRGEAGDGGSLAAVSRRQSLTTRKTIASEPAGTYRSPSPLPNGHLLVSYRAAGDAPGDTYGLYELDPASGRRVALILDDPGWHEVDAVAVRARVEPPGRSTVVDDARDSGQLNCLDAYITDRPEGPEVERGTIARVRVTAALKDPAVLGEAHVEPDGSFFLEVPARTPLRLETLDESGEVLRAMTGWFWVMPVERRGCIGCHEDRETAPPNRHVLALRKPPQAIGLAPRKTGNERGGEASKEPR